ncbi:MAG: FAD-dependent oxidoreductase [Chitinophagaceae bacterium]|nr:FAD-dependent oxidoreductase [Chitinophagaceae bacterium]
MNKSHGDKEMPRRKMIKYGVQSAALTLIGNAAASSITAEPVKRISRKTKSGKVVVIGAGAFGGWTALFLQRKGYDVTLIDQFGPGNNQSSSGGETRVIRAFYGSQQVYFDLTLRALDLWKENEKLMKKKVLYQNGLLVFVPQEKDPSVEASIPMYKNAGLTFEKVSPADAAKHWPQVNTKDLDHVMYDKTAGYLLSREACQEVCGLFVKEGGTFLQQRVASYKTDSGKCIEVSLPGGTKVGGDEFVFAVGPWMIRLFPELSKKIRVTRQVVFYFAPPDGESDLIENKLPCWFNINQKGIVDLYGIPGNEHRGFKAAGELTDMINDKFDTYDRYYNPGELKFVQDIVANRFPKMKGRPLIEHRVCQYTETPDSDFILDRHPETKNIWVMGGGSGHGYKMGPSMGELASQIVAGEKEIHPTFALERLLK